MRSTRTGFSLVELLVVVAIIGLLAAIGIPNFLTMQMVARRSELPSNVHGIKTAEQAYHTTYDQYLSLTAAPDASPGKQVRAWVDPDGNWTAIGWRPDGEIRGSYSAVDAGTDFTVYGESDADEDSARATYTATSSVDPVLITGYEVY